MMDDVIWTKSSYSGSQGGNCVEVAWRKSTRSNPSGNCVEFAELPGKVLVRDSKNPDGGIIEFAPDAWRKFIAAVKEGEFNL
jgi:hypothetical protein